MTSSAATGESGTGAEAFGPAAESRRSINDYERAILTRRIDQGFFFLFFKPQIHTSHLSPNIVKRIHFNDTYIADLENLSISKYYGRFNKALLRNEEFLWNVIRV